MSRVLAGDERGRVLKRALHFGERRDRYLGGQEVVEDAVPAEIAVGDT